MRRALQIFAPIGLVLILAAGYLVVLPMARSTARAQAKPCDMVTTDQISTTLGLPIADLGQESHAPTKDSHDGYRGSCAWYFRDTSRQLTYQVAKISVTTDPGKVWFNQIKPANGRANTLHIPDADSAYRIFSVDTPEVVAWSWGVTFDTSTYNAKLRPSGNGRAETLAIATMAVRWVNGKEGIPQLQ